MIKWTKLLSSSDRRVPTGRDEETRSFRGFGKPARRLRRITWSPNNSFHAATISGAGLFGTGALTVGCSDDFYAVRLGFANVASAPYTVGLTKVRSSKSWNDFVNPVGESPWTTVTSVHAGSDVDKIVDANDGPTSLVVRSNPNCASDGSGIVPSWSWTDWIPVRSASPDPTTNMRVLMIRHLIERGQTITYANGALDGLSGLDHTTNGFGTWTGGYNNGTDHVTVPDRLDRNLAQLNRLTNGSIVSAVQFATINGGIVGMTTGDSHQMGVGTKSSFNNFLYQAISAIGPKYVGRLPFGMVNCATGGATSRHFFDCLEALLPAVRPSFVVLPGWTFNDRSPSGDNADELANNNFVARLIKAADLCVLSGAVPIFLTPFPRNASNMTPTQVRPWLALRETILSQRNGGWAVIDGSEILGRQVDARLDGTYISTFTDDDIHPNDAGHAAVAKALVPLIQSISGLVMV